MVSNDRQFNWLVVGVICSPEVSSEEKTTARAFATVIVWRRDCWRRLELTKAGITPTIVMPVRVFGCIEGCGGFGEVLERYQIPGARWVQGRYF